jgi:phosphoglycerate dehydrogenase-like enzyme
MKVLLGWHATADEVATVEASLGGTADIRALPEREFDRYGASAEEMFEVGAEADILLTFVLPERYVQEAENLRFVSWMHHGYDRLPKALLAGRGITVANLAGHIGALDNAVAEQTWALLLGCAKRLVVKDDAVRTGTWCEQWKPGVASFEIAGKNLAVVGYGGIGRRVGAVGRAFGANVLAIKRRPEVRAEGADEVHPPEALLDVLARADYVVLAAPLNADTYKLIDERALAAMRSDACLINVARGEMVDERALHQALTEGWIAAYASDCWWDYQGDHPPGQHFPVPSRLGVHRLPNVVCSGDQSANTFEARDRIINGGADNVRAFIAGDIEGRLVDLAGV